ncbi:SUMF1/EgtB/PvdO family nonheme iron enzyme [Myxococcota bacterium]|nr:SUMF1/EgtB/PvdO family nonheme iron enzyme [Myxococcota bacterium]
MRDLVFICFSSEDRALCQELVHHLGPLLGPRLWYDERLAAGELIDDEIRDKQARTRLAVLLVTPSFLNRDYVTRVELPRLVADHLGGKLVMAPVFLSASVAKRFALPVPEGASKLLLGGVSGFNGPDDYFSQLPPAERALRWAAIAEKVDERLEALLTPAPPAPPTPPTPGPGLRRQPTPDALRPQPPQFERKWLEVLAEGRPSPPPRPPTVLTESRPTVLDRDRDAAPSQARRWPPLAIGGLLAAGVVAGAVVFAQKCDPPDEPAFPGVSALPASAPGTGLPAPALAARTGPSATPPEPVSAPAHKKLPATALRPAMVPIRGGTFRMGAEENPADRGSGYEPGSDETAHDATVSDFWMAETEVTQGQWRAVMGNNPSTFPACGEACPVETVSWWDAAAYTNALTAKEPSRTACYSLTGCSGTPGKAGHECADARLAPGCTGYRLPTEAEWEFATRSGTRAATYAGPLVVKGSHNAPVLDAIAWYGGNSEARYPGAFDCAAWQDKQDPHVRTCGPQPVRGKQPNPWGLYDMLGNVWEWTTDWHADYPASSPVDYVGPESGDHRVARGGSWGNGARGVSAASRNGGTPDLRDANLGFRVVLPAPRARP